jgi:hypothetical protein
VFSSADLVTWQDHGESFRSAAPRASLPFTNTALYAPDCVYLNGTYYLFFCTADNREGVAESASPAGPFTNAVPIQGADGDGIDPAALVDDDGQVYYYWGQFHLRGAKLQPDLRSIQHDTLQTALLTEAQDGFHEGAAIRKRNGIYYLVYSDISRGRPTCLSYATSHSPLGPFTKRGIIIDNSGCDPETWNNHGSIAEFKDQWYVFYHRSSQSSRFNRRVCVEPIHFNDDGSINEVEMTTQGIGEPLPAEQPIPAWRACLLNGRVHTAAVGPTEADPTVREHLTHIHHNNWAAYKYVDFGEGHLRIFTCRAGSAGYGGIIEIHMDAPDGELLGICVVPRTGGWQLWSSCRCRLQPTQGVHALYLVFRNNGEKSAIPNFDPDRLFDLESFWFSAD